MPQLVTEIGVSTGGFGMGVTIAGLEMCGFLDDPGVGQSSHCLGMGISMDGLGWGCA